MPVEGGRVLAAEHILLAQLARIAALGGDLKLAKQTFKELKASSNLRDTSGCEAAFHVDRAEVAVAEKNPEDAISALRAALTIWIDASAHIHAAHTRLRLAEILAVMGDVDEGEIEFASAEKAFAKMGAHPMAVRCRAARKAMLSRGRVVS